MTHEDFYQLTRDHGASEAVAVAGYAIEAYSLAWHYDTSRPSDRPSDTLLGWGIRALTQRAMADAMHELDVASMELLRH